MTLLRLAGTVRRYDWGSPTRIPALLGLEPDGRPCAEVWFGAHPAAPAWAGELPPFVEVDEVPRGARSLAALVADDPRDWLGPDCVTRFGPGLPFLVKLLAARRPLSLQVHPRQGQAAAGHAREVAAGVPGDRRLYADGRHKPEALLALAPTRALAGLRPAAAVAADLRALASPDVSPVLDALDGPGSEERRLAGGLAAVLRLPAAAVSAVSRVVAAPAGDGGDEPWTWSDDRRPPGTFEVVRHLARSRPDDPGVLAALFLEPVLLAPGDVLAVPPGTVHAYLEGFGVEAMASSDTVLRAGLTTKRVDVDEVLAALDARPGTAHVNRAPDLAPGEVHEVGSGAAEFALTVVRVDGDRAVDLPARGPRIAICVGGAVVVRGGGARHALAPGDAVAASHGTAVSAAGSGSLVVVHVPSEPPHGTSGGPPAHHAIRVR